MSQLIMKWWPVENSNLSFSKIVPMAVATGGQRIWSLSQVRKSTKGHYIDNGFLFGIPSPASYWNGKAYTMQMAYFININRSPGNRCSGDWGERRSLYFSNSNNSDDKFLPLSILNREQRNLEFFSLGHSVIFKSKTIKISIFGQGVLMCRNLW